MGQLQAVLAAAHKYQVTRLPDPEPNPNQVTRLLRWSEAQLLTLSLSLTLTR